MIEISAAGKICGESHSQAKLTRPKADEIRRLFAQGETVSHLSRQFLVTRRAVRLVVTGKTWAPPASHSYRATDNDLRIVRRMISEGATIRAVQGHLHATLGSVLRLMAKHGIAPANTKKRRHPTAKE